MNYYIGKEICETCELGTEIWRAYIHNKIVCFQEIDGRKIIQSHIFRTDELQDYSNIFYFFGDGHMSSVNKFIGEQPRRATIKFEQDSFEIEITETKAKIIFNRTENKNDIFRNTSGKI